jgi:hypothetical protein
MLTNGAKVKVMIFLVVVTNVCGLVPSYPYVKRITALEKPRLFSFVRIHSKFQRLRTSSTQHEDSRSGINGFFFNRSKKKSYAEFNVLKAVSSVLSLDRAMLPRSASILYKFWGYFSGLSGIFTYVAAAILASTIVQLLLVLFRRSSEEGDGERPSSLGGIIWSKIVNVVKSIRSSETSSIEEAALDLSKWNVCKLQVCSNNLMHLR